MANPFAGAATERKQGVQRLPAILAPKRHPCQAVAMLSRQTSDSKKYLGNLENHHLVGVAADCLPEAKETPEGCLERGNTRSSQIFLSGFWRSLRIY